MYTLSFNIVLYLLATKAGLLGKFSTIVCCYSQLISIKIIMWGIHSKYIIFTERTQKMIFTATFKVISYRVYC